MSQKKYYVFKYMQGDMVVYVGATTQRLSNGILNTSRRHPNNPAFSKDAEIYYLECNRKDIMKKMRDGAILYYKPMYNCIRYIYQTSALQMNYDVFNWKRYKKGDAGSDIKLTKEISKPVPLRRIFDPNIPTSLNEWTLVCPDDVLLTNEHIELISFIYGNPSLGRESYVYEFQGLSSFRPLIAKYGNGRYVVSLLHDLARIQLLPPIDHSCKIADTKIPLISLKNEDGQLTITANQLYCIREMIQSMFRSELFYIWHTGTPSIETCWVSPMEYDVIWGFRFKNALLRYESEFEDIFKRCSI